MRRTHLALWGATAGLISACCPTPVAAQGFSSGSLLYEPDVLRSEGVTKDRWQLSLYTAFWNHPARSFGAFRDLHLDVNPSPLIVVDYRLGRTLSVGGWWNPYDGSYNGVARSTGPLKIAEFGAHFWDLYLTYRPKQKWARGWSVQAGYSRQSYSFRLTPALRNEIAGNGRFEFTNEGANLWVHRAQRIATIQHRGRGYPLTGFVSMGHYFSRDFERSYDIITGATLGLGGRWSVSGSVWFANLDDVKTRMTFGITATL